MEYRNFVNPKRNELKEGELTCDKCNGTGCIPSKDNPHEIASLCSKCQGAGIVDWIENIVGKPPIDNYSSTSGNYNIPTQKAVKNYVGKTRTLWGN